jgi:hypothetical protein
MYKLISHSTQQWPGLPWTVNFWVKLNRTRLFKQSNAAIEEECASRRQTLFWARRSSLAVWRFSISSYRTGAAAVLYMATRRRKRYRYRYILRPNVVDIWILSFWASWIQYDYKVESIRSRIPALRTGLESFSSWSHFWSAMLPWISPFGTGNC